MLQNFNGIIESEVLIMEVQRLKDIFSIACMTVHAYHNTLRPGQMMYVQNDATQDNVSCRINYIPIL